MRKRKTMNKKNKMIAIVVTLLILLLIGASIKNIVVLHLEHKALIEEKKELEKKKKSLQEELKNVNELDYIEDQARKQLRMVKPGEKLYIVDKDKSQKDDISSDDKKEKESSND